MNPLDLLKQLFSGGQQSPDPNAPPQTSGVWNAMNQQQPMVSQVPLVQSVANQVPRAPTHAPTPVPQMASPPSTQTQSPSSGGILGGGIQDINSLMKMYQGGAAGAGAAASAAPAGGGFIGGGIQGIGKLMSLFG